MFENLSEKIGLRARALNHSQSNYILLKSTHFLNRLDYLCDYGGELIC